MKQAIAVIILLFIAAGSLVVAGVQLLVGLPWALIATGLFLFLAALALRTGLTPNG